MKKIHKGYICSLILLWKIILEFLVYLYIIDDTASDTSLKMTSEGGETARSSTYLAPNMQNTFSFKIQDKKGRLHRFTCGMTTNTCYQSDIYTQVCCSPASMFDNMQILISFNIFLVILSWISVECGWDVGLHVLSELF